MKIIYTLSVPGGDRTRNLRVRKSTPYPFTGTLNAYYNINNIIIFK